MVLDGFHGTSQKVATQIINGSYQLSIGDEEWLGDGVYFFIEGLSLKPNNQAKQWAIAQSWDNRYRRHKYRRWAVLHSKIEVEEENFLDLTEPDGLDILNYILESHEKCIRRINKNFDYIDGLVINFARQENLIPVDVVKGNFYIKFIQERKSQFRLRTPNSTICTVFDPLQNITNTKITQTGSI